MYLVLNTEVKSKWNGTVKSWRNFFRSAPPGLGKAGVLSFWVLMWYNFSTAFFQPPLTVVVWLRDLTQKCVQPGQLLQLLAWWHWPAGCHFLAKRGPQIATAASQLWGRQEWGTAGSRVSWERSKETASELCVKSHQSLGFVTCHGSKASGKNCRLIFQGEWLIPLLFRFPDSCQYKNLGLMGFLLFTYCGWYFFTKTGTNTLMLNS